MVAAVQKILNPCAYKAGRDGITALRAWPMSAPYLDSWTVPFAAMSVIVNRMTPYHRDCNAPLAATDLMLTIGGDEPWPEDQPGVGKGWMELKGLGIALDYPSGSMVSMNTK